MNCWGILPAAGSGSRFGAEVPKQYLPVNGRPVIYWSIETLLAAPLQALIIPLSPGDTHWPTLPLSPNPVGFNPGDTHGPNPGDNPGDTHGRGSGDTHGPNPRDTHRGSGDTHGPSPGDTHWPTLGRGGENRIEICAGGAQRQQSVLNALLALRGRADEEDWILVHDAVRPCVRGEDITSLIAMTDASGMAGGMLGWPADNSLKRVASSMTVLDNVDRRDCWNAATPQMFRYGVLLDALRRAEAEKVFHTDESAAVMAAGGSVLMVSGARDNIKITHEPDLALAAAILAQRQGART